MNRLDLLLRLIPTPVITGAATLGPIGYIGKAPGTNGSIAGILWFILLHAMVHTSSPFLYYLVLALSVGLAVVVCGEAEERMFKRDPGEIILDEFVAVPLCFIGLGAWLAPGTLIWTALAGFALFRFFDIVKPLGIKSLQRHPGGTGVVLDDVAAALATCAILHIARLFL